MHHAGDARVRHAGPAGVEEPSASDAWLNNWLARMAARPALPDAADLAQLRQVPIDRLITALSSGAATRSADIDATIYRCWMEANPASPFLFAAWFNIGALQARAARPVEAATAYANALALRPDLPAAALNLGLTLEAMGRQDEALAAWNRALQPDAARIELLLQQARLLEERGQFDAAELAMRRLLYTDTDQPDVIHHWLHVRQKMCLWPVAAGGIGDASPDDLLRMSGPLGMLALTDDIDTQREAAAAWIARKLPPAPHRLAPPRPYRHDRIRLGYLSSDFGAHAISYLIAEVIERHARDRFEVFGYCAGQQDGSRIRARILAGFDTVRLIRSQTDEQAAQMIRDDEIDVLIDLNGLTRGNRLGVLRWKPAPVQATYLGFMGSVPLPELDYLLCDPVLIPPEHLAAYQPQPLSIGPLFQANDSLREQGPALSRAEAGLPAHAFVFCCFAPHYKITQAMFGVWMQILGQARDAVLWLTHDNDWSRDHLTRAAGAAGIDPSRLLFASRADANTYLSRLALADLYLDTFPYNAGTVASDAIRVGLPVLTLCGRAMASRMATSLLHAVGAHSGIACNPAQYVDIAARLARDRPHYARYRALFAPPAWRTGIGDAARFTAGLEAALAAVVTAPSGG